MTAPTIERQGEQATVRHPIRCGCYSCAEWRQAMRRRGLMPLPALDWRGEELPGGND